MIKKFLRKKFFCIFDKFGYYLPKKICQTIRFRRNHSYSIDWMNPSTFDEKMTCYLLTLGKKEAQYADKIECRNIIKEKGYEHLLVPSFGVWENAKDIDVSKLPESFVLKTNNGCGNHIFCENNKTEIDWHRELKNLNKIMKRNYARIACEYHYKFIKRGIIAEKLLNQEDNESMIDYKVHCFNGKPHCILVCSERETELKLNWFDLQWNYLDYGYEQYESKKTIKKPECLNEMLECCEKIVGELPFARVDFYCIKGKAYIGEITITPAGGALFYLNDKGQKTMGRLFQI